jgi:hypothetical protein
MIDAKRYLRLSPKGLTKIVEKEDGFYLQFARYNVEDGTIIEPEEQKIDIEEIHIRQNELEKELNGINLLLNNIPG